MPDTPACRAAVRIMLSCTLPLDDGEIAMLEEYRDELLADAESVEQRIAVAKQERERRQTSAAWRHYLADRADIRERQA